MSTPPKIVTIGDAPTDDIVIPGPQGWARAMGEVPPEFITMSVGDDLLVWSQEFQVRKVITGVVEHIMQPVPRDTLHTIDFTQPLS